MIERDPLNLTGEWAGASSYLGSDQADLAFTATFEEVAGLVSGTTGEANLVAGMTMRVGAVVRGTREGHEVTFRKSYDGVGDPAQAIDHFGTLSPDGLRITGFWKQGDASGGFEMDRSLADAGEEQVLEMAAPSDFGALMAR